VATGLNLWPIALVFYGIFAAIALAELPLVADGAPLEKSER